METSWIYKPNLLLKERSFRYTQYRQKYKGGGRVRERGRERETTAPLMQTSNSM
jgi:hypothetical protein